MAQSVDITDAIVSKVDHRREVADSVSLSDAVSRVTAHLRNLSDALGVTDDATGGRVIFRLARTPR